MAYNAKFRDAIDWRYTRPFNSTRPLAVAVGASKKGHKWTPFQHSALFGLMAAQYHTGDQMQLATMLNQGLHDTDFRQDIKARYIEKEVNRILTASPEFSNLLMRHKAKRATRKLRMAFDRAILPKGRKRQADEGYQTGGWADDAPQADNNGWGALAAGADNDGWGNDASQVDKNDGVTSAAGVGNGGWGGDSGQASGGNESAPAAVPDNGCWGDDLVFLSIETADNGWGTGGGISKLQSINERTSGYDGWGTGDAVPPVQTTHEPLPDFDGWGAEDAPTIQSANEVSTTANDGGWGTGTAAVPNLSFTGQSTAVGGWGTGEVADTIENTAKARSTVVDGWETDENTLPNKPLNRDPVPTRDAWGWGASDAPAATEPAKHKTGPVEDDLGWGTVDVAPPLVEPSSAPISSDEGGWGALQTPASKAEQSEFGRWGPVDELIAEYRPKSIEEAGNKDTSSNVGGVENVEANTAAEPSGGIHPDRLRLLEISGSEKDDDSGAWVGESGDCLSFFPTVVETAASHEKETPENRLAMIEKMNPSSKSKAAAPNRNTQEFATFESHMAELQIQVGMPQVEKETTDNISVADGEYKTFSRPKPAALRVLDDEDDLALNYDYEELPKSYGADSPDNGKPTPGWIGDCVRTPGWDTSYRTPAWTGPSKSRSAWGGRTPSGFEDPAGRVTPTDVMNGAATPGTNWEDNDDWGASSSSPPPEKPHESSQAGTGTGTTWDDPEWASFSTKTPGEKPKEMTSSASNSSEGPSESAGGWGDDDLAI